MAVAVAVAAGAPSSLGSFFSTTSVSVVSTIAAIDAALRSADRVTLTGSMTPAAMQVAVVAGRRVEALADGQLAHLGGDDVALQAGVLGDPAQRLGAALRTMPTPGRLVAGQAEVTVERRRRRG